MAHIANEIAQGVAFLPVSIANVYFVDSTRGEWVLVDTGVPGKADQIREAAERRYGPGARPAAILLTHGHWDHAGSALDLANFWDVPVYAHPLELPFLTRKSAYPPFDPTAPGFMAFVTRFVGNIKPFDLGDRVQPLESDQDPAGLTGWNWHHTPGHAPGHVSFYRRSDATLLAGDAFTTVNLDSLFAIVTKRQQISRPPTPSTIDWAAARESVQRLAALKPFTLACGHGTPMSGNQAALDFADFARKFPIPSRGRYVTEPAQTDENGIVYLPPKPPDRVPAIAASVGVAALVGTMIAVAANRRRA